MIIDIMYIYVCIYTMENVSLQLEFDVLEGVK